MHKTIYLKPVLLFSFLLSFMFACDTTSNVQPKYSNKVSIRSVFVPAKTGFGPELEANPMAGSLKEAPEGSYYEKENLPPPSPYGCHNSWINNNPNAEYKYVYRTVFLYFPEGMIKSADGVFKYVKSEALDPDGNTMGIRNCIVPNMNTAERMIESFIRIDSRMTNPEVELSFNTSSRSFTKTQ